MAILKGGKGAFVTSRCYHLLAHGSGKTPLFFLLPLMLYAIPSLLRDIYGMEARNALFAREIFQQGISIIPCMMGRPYPDYPPLYFILEYIFSIPAGRVTTFSAVLPSAISAACLVYLTWTYARKVSPDLALISSLVLATAPGFWLRAGHATVDMMLALTTFGAFLVLMKLAENHHSLTKTMSLAFSALILIGLSMLIKGPVGVVIPLGATGLFFLMERSWKKLFILCAFSLGAAILLAGLYFSAVYLQGGKELALKVWGNQVGDRVGTQPNKPAYYYIIQIVTSFSPWLLLIAILPIIMRRTSKEALQHCHVTGAQKNFKQPNTNCSKLLRQCASGTVFIFALFTVASSRHGRYLLPAYPFIAILIAAGIQATACHVWKKHLKSQSQNSLNSRHSSTGPVAIYHLAGRASVITAVLTAGLLLLNAVAVEPVMASRESGRRFMEQVERQNRNNYPVLVYGINPDGDGLKLSFYSNTRLHFFRNPEDLKGASRPAIVILYKKRIKELEKIRKNVQTRQIASGLVHRKEIIALELKSDKRSI